MIKRLGRQTIELKSGVYIKSHAAVVGEKEGEGPLAHEFDMVVSDDRMGQASWELAESALLHTAAELAVKKSGLKYCDMDYVLSGDLQNQCVSAHYGLRSTQIPFFGIYGACSTMCESLSLGAILVASGAAEHTLCVTSSHFCSAEKQYRNPLEYGGQRTPSAQWTVTGSGGIVLSKYGTLLKITHITTGRIVDMGVKDISNMGAAMAPAAAGTLAANFRESNRNPAEYDLILTGDLGVIGSEILHELLLKEGYDIRKNHKDCGKMIYSIAEQDVHAGASGCGCCASVLCGHILKKMEHGEFKRIIVAATGALMNPITIEQGESIPAISHAVVIERE